MNLARRALWLCLLVSFVAPPAAHSEEESLPAAVNLIRQAKPTEAIPILESYIDRNLNDPAGHYWLGLALDQIGQPAHAIVSYSNALQAAVKAGRDSAQLRVNIGNTYMRLHKPDEAILNFRRAIELQPNNIKAREGLSHALMTVNKTKEALAELDKCAQLGSCDPALNYYRALALKSAGQEKAAQSQMDAFLKNLPETAANAELKSQIRDIIESKPASQPTSPDSSQTLQKPRN